MNSDTRKDAYEPGGHPVDRPGIATSCQAAVPPLQYLVPREFLKIKEQVVLEQRCVN